MRLNGASESMESLVGMLVRITAQMARPLKAASLDRLPGVELCDLAAKLLNTMLDLLGMPLELRKCGLAHGGWHGLLHPRPAWQRVSYHALWSMRQDAAP